MTRTKSFDSLIALLTTDQPPRVWSLLVTIFGDLCLEPDEWISGTVLNRITQTIGIKPEATRVALHRLKKDNWITSQKTGRRSFYALTDEGRCQSIEASPRIYGSAPAAQCWLLILPPNPQSPDAKITPINPHLALTTAPRPDDFAQNLTGQTLPDWMRCSLCDEKLAQTSRHLDTTLTDLENALPAPLRLDPLQTAALRVLIVHSWRRVILKAPNLPDSVFPESWKGAECRDRTAKLLESLPKPSLSDLELATQQP